MSDDNRDSPDTLESMRESRNYWHAECVAERAKHERLRERLRDAPRYALSDIGNLDMLDDCSDEYQQLCESRNNVWIRAADIDEALKECQ